MRYLISFSYDGNCFYGYQRQKNKKTVQGVIEQQLSKLVLKNIFIHSSGRTDKGVHALNQKAHFDLDLNIKIYSLKKYLNDSLNGEIYINGIKNVENDFHAQYSVKSKTYSYYINTGEFNVFKRNYVYQFGKHLDVEAMKTAASYFLGEHDFRSFCKQEKERKNCVRNIYDISISIDKNIVKITISGNGFLRQMVRNIVEILIEIGLHKKDEEYLNNVLMSNGNIHYMKTVPGCGLYLENVNY